MLHGALAYLLWEEDAPATAPRAHPELRLQLTAQDSQRASPATPQDAPATPALAQTETQAPSPAPEALEPTPARTPIPITRAQVEEEPREPAVAPEPTTVPPPDLDLRSRSVITSIAASAEPELNTCSVLDQATRAKRCMEEARVFGTEPEPLVQLPRAPANATYAADMARVAKLEETIALLGRLEGDDLYAAALVREQQHTLRQEIKRIDRKYASFNLLKAIPMARKAIKGLREKAEDK
ncbi:MAG: hypothetical protein AAF513_10310 [Pseudomonadota bacterium]